MNRGNLQIHQMMTDPQLTHIHSFPSSPNEIINLVFDEIFEMQQGKVFKRGKGRIYLSWFPYPNVRFEMEIKYPPLDQKVMRQRWDNFKKVEEEISQNTKIVCGEELKEILSLISTGDAELKFANNASLNALKINIQRVGRHPNHKSFQNPCDEILGHLNDQQIGVNINVQYLQFYLSNFYSMSFETEIEGWRLTLDATENIDSLLRALEREGGYCISHTARLERLDNSHFDIERAREVLVAISQGFSFMRGIRIAPILISGCNENGETLYQELGFSWATPWEQDCNFTCMATPSQKDLRLFVSGFFKKWREQTWQNPLKSIIQWYVEAVRATGGLEGSIILLQTALETLAWVLIVDDQGTSVEAFVQESNNASKKINHLLRTIKVSNKIPDSLAELKNYSSSLELWGRDNGPIALCNVRNDITHASPENRKKLYALDDSVIVETRRLGLWYVELSLLWIVAYQGNYYNRTSDSNKWCVEPVPWITSIS